MTICFTIVNNYTYSMENGLVIPAGKCGNVAEEVPYELCLSSDSLMDIFTILGVKSPHFNHVSEYTGMIDGQIISRAIDLFLNDCPHSTEVGCPTMSDQEFYQRLFQIAVIARHAEKREEYVMWD